MKTKDSYNVFVPGGKIEKDGVEFQLKKEFLKTFNEKEAQNYFNKLKEKFTDVVMEIKKVKVYSEKNYKIN